jgi:glutaredoxin 3
MAQVKIYTVDYCPYCYRAKALLERKGVPFEEIDVTHDPKTRAWLAKVTGRRTVPQTFIDDQPVGGCDDLHDLEASGQLDRMLSR